MVDIFFVGSTSNGVEIQCPFLAAQNSRWQLMAAFLHFPTVRFDEFQHVYEIESNIIVLVGWLICVGECAMDSENGSLNRTHKDSAVVDVVECCGTQLPTLLETFWVGDHQFGDLAEKMGLTKRLAQLPALTTSSGGHRRPLWSKLEALRALQWAAENGGGLTFDGGKTRRFRKWPKKKGWTKGE